MYYRFGMFILVAVWTLMAAPLVCGGGLLSHGCPDDGDAACAHESACPGDPCNVVALDGAAKVKVKHDLDAVADAPGIELTLPSVPRPMAPACPEVLQLPLPAAALPLLC